MKVVDHLVHHQLYTTSSLLKTIFLPPHSTVFAPPPTLNSSLRNFTLVPLWLQQMIWYHRPWTLVWKTGFARDPDLLVFCGFLRGSTQSVSLAGSSGGRVLSRTFSISMGVFICPGTATINCFLQRSITVRRWRCCFSICWQHPGIIVIFQTDDLRDHFSLAWKLPLHHSVISFMFTASS